MLSSIQLNRLGEPSKVSYMRSLIFVFVHDLLLKSRKLCKSIQLLKCTNMKYMLFVHILYDEKCDSNSEI